MIMDDLTKFLKLDEEDADQLEELYFELEDDIMELLELHRKYNELLRKTSKLHSEVARYNFQVYEMWMNLHSNAISLSSYRAEINLRGIEIDNKFLEEINGIIDKYLLMEKFT